MQLSEVRFKQFVLPSSSKKTFSLNATTNTLRIKFHIAVRGGEALLKSLLGR